MTGFIVSLVASILALGGLVFDGSRLVAARAELADHAAGAARAAAQQLVDVRLGNERIDVDDGRTAALRYLARHGLDGQVRINGLRVEVTVESVVPMTLLAAVGVNDQVVVVTRQAELVEQ